jgi:hypothetical protein
MQLLHREVQDVNFAFHRLIFCMLLQKKILNETKNHNVGSKNDAINYRGITVLPVISKIVKAVIRDRIQPLIHNMQNPTQRGLLAGLPYRP